MIVNALTCKQKKIKTKKEKDIILYTQVLIKLDKILEYKIALLNMKIDLINKLDLINISSLMTVVIINNKESFVY